MLFVNAAAFVYVDVNLKGTFLFLTVLQWKLVLIYCECKISMKKKILLKILKYRKTVFRGKMLTKQDIEFF